MGDPLSYFRSKANRHVVTASLVILMSAGPASGQQVCQLMPDPENPGWQVLSCRPDVEVSPSADAVFSLTDDDGNGQVDTLNLDAGAIRTRVDGRVDSELFHIRTRQAIVSVRGTDWATALSDGGTEVFVVSGEVQVTDLALAGGVVLTEGLGVDVPDLNAAPEITAREDDAMGESAPSAGIAAPSDTAPEPQPTFLQPVRWGAERADTLLARFPGT